MSQLAMNIIATPPARPTRNLRGLCRFDDKVFAEAYIARYGALAWIARGVTVNLKPRKVGSEWILCAFHSGRPYALEVGGKKLRRMRVADIS
jgi:hypothetical protein